MKKERSSFTLVFGPTPIIKVIDFLLTFDSFDYSIAQISREISTKWESVESAIIFLLKKKIVKATRRVGKAQLYMLNKDSPITKLLSEIDFKISKLFIEKELAKQKKIAISA